MTVFVLKLSDRIVAVELFLLKSLPLKFCSHFPFFPVSEIWCSFIGLLYRDWRLRRMICVIVLQKRYAELLLSVGKVYSSLELLLTGCFFSFVFIRQEGMQYCRQAWREGNKLYMSGDLPLNKMYYPLILYKHCY